MSFKTSLSRVSLEIFAKCGFELAVAGFFKRQEQEQLIAGHSTILNYGYSYINQFVQFNDKAQCIRCFVE